MHRNAKPELDKIREEITSLLVDAGALSSADIAMNLRLSHAETCQALGVLRRRKSVCLAEGTTPHRYQYEAT